MDLLRRGAIGGLRAISNLSAHAANVTRPEPKPDPLTERVNQSGSSSLNSRGQPSVPPKKPATPMYYQNPPSQYPSPAPKAVNNVGSISDGVDERAESKLVFYHRVEGMKASQRSDHMNASYHYEAAADEQVKFILLADPGGKIRDARYRFGIILYTSAYEAYLAAGGVKGDDRCKSLIQKQKAVSP